MLLGREKNARGGHFLLMAAWGNAMIEGRISPFLMPE
jgi:hypothetical protein